MHLENSVLNQLPLLSQRSRYHTAIVFICWDLQASEGFPYSCTVMSHNCFERRWARSESIHTLEIV